MDFELDDEGLTLEQKGVLTELLFGKDYVVSITGAAGSGKTFLAKKYVAQCQGEVAVCAYTGVAASLHPDGKTLHSFLFSLDKDFAEAMKIKEFIAYLEAKDSLKYFPNGAKRLSPKQQYLLGDKLQEYFSTVSESGNDDAFYQFFETVCKRSDYTHLTLVIDESSMIPKRMMDLLLRKFLFKKIVLVGDKYQIAPVSSDKGYCYSVLPIQTRHLELTQIIRQTDTAMLTALRNTVMGIDQEANVKILNSFFNKTKSPFRKEDLRIYYSNAEKNEANADRLKHSDTVRFMPGIHFLEDFDLIRSKVPWLAKTKDLSEMKKEIRQHYAASLASAIVTVASSGLAMSLKNQAKPLGRSRIMFANGHIAELRNAVGGFPRSMVRQDATDVEKKRASYRYDDCFHYNGHTFPVLGKTKPFHSTTAPYFTMVCPAIQYAFAFTYHKTQGMTIEPPACIGIYMPNSAIDMTGLMYVALTRCKEFSQINLHGKLDKDYFQYDFQELAEPDRIIDNTVAVETPIKAA